MATLEEVSTFFQQSQHGFQDGILYVDWIEIIARKATELTFGQGIIVESDKTVKGKNVQKLLNNWLDKTNALSIFRTGEWQSSAWGKTVLYLTESTDGTPRLHYLRNIFNGRVAKINEEEQLADIWNQDYQGDSNIFTRTTITKDYIRVRQYGGEYNQINDVKAEVSAGLKPKKDIKLPNNFHRLPVVEIINRTYNNWMNQTQVNINPDWAPAMGLIKFYNNAFLIANKEIVANRTRYFGSLPSYKLKQIKDRVKSSAMLGIADAIGDAWINQSFATAYSNQATGSSLQVVQGDPKLQEYANFLDELEVKIMNMSGYEANQRVNSDTYENKTASLYSNKLDEQTTTFKRTDRTPKIYQLLDCVLSFYGIEPIQDDERIYTIRFIDSGINKTTQMTDDVIKKLNARLMTRAQARAELFGEPLSVAEENVKKAMEEDMAEQQQYGEMNNQLEADNWSKVNGEEPKQSIKPEKDTLEGADK